MLYHAVHYAIRVVGSGRSLCVFIGVIPMSDFLFGNIFRLQTFTLEPDVPSKGGQAPYMGEPYREFRVSGHQA